ncbi:cation transporter [Planctomicrobium sp. SH661]|uniref:cation transporter n=1 Tax=Planctomicrobium sp. SH661 TaxID=3448124 RepID=UPI003F5BFF52
MFRVKLATLSHAAFAFMVMATSSVWAAEIKVEGVHLCCGGCVKAASQSLSKVDGVSAVNVDKDHETVTFEAADDAAAQRGLKALASSGFYGKTSVPGPESKIDPDKTADEVQVTGVHLCCGGCVDVAKDAAASVAGVRSVEAVQKKGTLTIKGEKINLAATLKALHDAGLHGEVK